MAPLRLTPKRIEAKIFDVGDKDVVIGDAFDCITTVLSTDKKIAASTPLSHGVTARQKADAQA